MMRQRTGQEASTYKHTIRKVKGHHEVFKPEGKKIPDFCAQKSQTRGLVWVTRGPIETIFVKTIFKIRVKKFCPSLPAT